MTKEIRSTIYMKEDMYDKFRLACNYKFGDKQGKIKKGMIMAIEFFIEVVDEEKALAKTNQQTSTPEPELSGLIAEGVIEKEPKFQNEPTDFTENLDDSPTLSAQTHDQAETPTEELPEEEIPQELTEEKSDEIVEDELEQDEEIPMVSRLEPPPDLTQMSFSAKEEIASPQEVVEEEVVEPELDQVVKAKKSYKAEPEVQSEGQKIVQEAIRKEAEASVALDHGELQTVTELDQVKIPPQQVVEPEVDNKIVTLAKRLADERRKRNLA